METVMALPRKADGELVRLCDAELGWAFKTASGGTVPLARQMVFHLFRRGYHAGKIISLRALLSTPRLLG